VEGLAEGRPGGSVSDDLNCFTKNQKGTIHGVDSGGIIKKVWKRTYQLHERQVE
jgi:hypothetical protein